MLKEIIAGLVLFIITAVLTFIWRRVSIKPIINIYFEPGGPSSSTSAPNPRQLYLKWERTIVFKNNSKYDAMELKIIWPSNQPHLHLEIEKDGHLKAFDSLKKEINAESYISREEIEKHSNDRFEYFMPVELKNLMFILSYKNEVGKRFYIRYKKKDSEEIVDKTPKLIKPKFKKQFCI